MSGDAQAGKSAVREALSKVANSIRLEGEMVQKDDEALVVRRGGSVFEVASSDIMEVRELDGGKVEVLIIASAQLIRSTVVRSHWHGSGIGWRPVFEDCSDCTDCSVCTDCNECSYCTDCTECSDCSGIWERGRIGGRTSSWVRRFSGSWMAKRF